MTVRVDPTLALLQVFHILGLSGYLAWFNPSVQIGFLPLSYSSTECLSICLRLRGGPSRSVRLKGFWRLRAHTISAASLTGDGKYDKMGTASHEDSPSPGHFALGNVTGSSFVNPSPALTIGPGIPTRVDAANSVILAILRYP